MARHAITDTPTRGVLEYWWHYNDNSSSERRRHVFGPYDSPSIAKSRTRQESRDRLINLNNRHPGHWRGWSEIIEIRYEQVKEWEVTGIEFTLP